jgi:hypothetical protein
MLSTNIFDSCIRGKSVCLLCCGQSLEEQNIDFSVYDTCVGTNRLYKCPQYFEHVDIYFDGCHERYDPLTDKKIQFLNAYSRLKFVVFLPGKPGLRQLRQHLNTGAVKLKAPSVVKNVSRRLVKRMSLGVEAICAILRCKPKKLDIFGLDYYVTPYIKDLEHDDVYDDFFRPGRNFFYEQLFCCRLLREYEALRGPCISLRGRFQMQCPLI